MQATTVYHVVPARSGWALHTHEGETAYADKLTALRQGQEMARASRGQLVIHRDDGSVQAEHSY
jgi:hypothetical protein